MFSLAAVFLVFDVRCADQPNCTYVPLSLSSIIWFWPKASDAR